ncbi:MAG TPA: thymidine phosphorylase [bacterium]
MNPVEIIAKKRDGKTLSSEEIAWMVDGYVHNHIPDYQISALLMAIVLRGMDGDEILSLTKTLIASGQSMDLSSVPGIKVDKHSTGGVGDKISLVLAPLVACAGVPVPMMAGRSLGHTGGTLDKLESIPGFRTDLSETEFIHQVSEIGCAIMGQTNSIVPADKKLYALRDVTGTVNSIPLICASIISKKKAEGTDALVLDVKTGRGAFFPSREKTVELAQTLVALGNGLGIRTEALVTDMNQPLGRAVGNWLEILESVDALQGRGPDDVIEITLALGSAMLMLAGKAPTPDEGRRKLRTILDSGLAYDRFLAMVERQGGDVQLLAKPESTSRRANRFAATSPADGYVAGVDAMEAGLLCVSLGAGRMRQEDEVDPAAGIVFHKKTGDPVRRGELLAEGFTNRMETGGFLKRLLGAYTFSADPVPPPNLLVDRYPSGGWGGPAVLFTG